jgi:branched-chain amino acid transport system substrate-binding protein
VESTGLAVSQGIVITQPFYWDLNDASRSWAARFTEREHGHSPTAFHAGVYSSVMAYLDAVHDAGSNDAAKVIPQLKRHPIDDPLFGPVTIRPDGRAVHNMYILKAKDPKSSKSKWDLLDQAGLLSGDEAFRPINQGGCKLVKAAGN